MITGSEGCRLDALARKIGASLIGDGEKVVHRIRFPDEAERGDVAFAPHPRFLRSIKKTRAAALLCDLNYAAEHADELPCAVIAAENPPLALAKAFEILQPARRRVAVIDDRAAIHVDAQIGLNVSIGAFAFVGRASIGAECRIGPQVFIDDDVLLGNRVTIAPGAVILQGAKIGNGTFVQAGAVIGTHGFRFAADGERNVRIPQPETVEVGADVEIGANATLDRGDLRATRIGDGVRIDHHVQVGHGAQIGKHSVIVGQSAIGGDTVLGDRVVLGGQVGVVPYVVIGDDARIGGKSGVRKDVPARAAVTGYPAYDHADWLRTSVRQPRLTEILRRLQAAEEEIQALKRARA